MCLESKNFNRESPQHLYHYTKLGVLKEIFNDPNGRYVTLLLSEYHSLNDAEEGNFLYNFLRDYKESIVNLFAKENEKKYCRCAIDDFIKSDSYVYRMSEQEDKHFSFSLSELRDSMQFWRQDYANENGIALRFDWNRCKNECLNNCVPLGQIQYLNVQSFDSIFSQFVQTVKAEAEYVNHIGECDDEGTPLFEMSGSYVLSHSPFWLIKNAVWKSEKECRLVKTIKALNLSMDKCLGKNLELPYEIGEDLKPRYRMMINNPFDEIILGPDIPEGYVGYVKDWLKQRNYDLKVLQSSGRIRHRIEI